jgi:hypothetical protein
MSNRPLDAHRRRGRIVGRQAIAEWTQRALSGKHHE